ncbi:hypothetical protein ACFL6P_08480 [Candidatus Latescibacterota bacterium]
MPSPLKKSFAAEQLKKRKKKPPMLLVVAVIVAIIAVGYVLYMRYGTKEIPTETVAPLEEIKSVAVLAFEDMTSEKNMEHVGDGIAEAIIGALTNIEGIRVPGRNSTFVFKGQYKEIREIGEKLDVDAVLEGSIQQSGERLRITAQLIRVKDDNHLFSKTYDHFIMEDIFTIQDSISYAIVETLRGELLNGEKAAIEKRLTENTEAYDLYLMGQHFTIIFEWRKALDFYFQAIEKDSSFAAPYAEIALLYSAMAGQGSIAPGKAYTEAKKAVERAFELDDTLPNTHLAQAMLSLYFEWDWDTAEDNFKKAIEIDPSYMTTYTEIDNLLTLLGKEQEMLELQIKALEIDPLSLGVMQDMLPILGLLGDSEQAEQIYHKMVEIDSTWWGINHVGFNYAFQGKYEEAIEAFTKRAELSGYSEEPNPYIGYVYGLMGKRVEAEKILADYQAEFPEAVRYINLIRLGLKDFDPIFETLENRYNERNPHIVYNLLRHKRHSKDIVADPRWNELMKKMGLPES